MEDIAALQKQDHWKLSGCPGLNPGCADVAKVPAPAQLTPGLLGSLGLGCREQLTPLL